VRAHFNFSAASEDHRDVLARKPAAVIVSTPHHLHYAQTCDVLAAGAHVLVEKPMTLDPGEAWDLVRRARAAKRHLLVANGYHYLPGVDELRAMICDGAVGRIEHVMTSFISATRAVFDGAEGMKRWQTTFFRPDRATWQAPEQGGGFAYGQHSHSIALALWLTGLVPRRISAQSWGPGDVDLVSAAALACDGGATIALSGAAAMPEGERALMRIFIAGSEGVFDIAFDRDEAELRRHDGTRRRLAIAPGQWNYHCEGPPLALVDLAQGGGRNRSPGEIGAATVAVISALLASARARGGPRDIDIPADHGLNQI
jgi:predicted dehydrogenase